jgi:hypothetical protein
MGMGTFHKNVAQNHKSLMGEKGKCTDYVSSCYEKIQLLATNDMSKKYIQAKFFLYELMPF